MIPRTKVSYDARTVLRSLLIREDGPDHRAALARQLSEYLGARHVLLTPSGRGALYFLLKALPHRRIIVPAYTCSAVTEAARLAGKDVEYAPIEPGEFNASAEALAERGGPDAAIVATHQFGIACDIEKICASGAAKGAFVIEDVAPALGTRIGGRLAGTFGDAAFFSFDSTKLVNVPLKAGFLTVKDAALFAQVGAAYAAEIERMPITRGLALRGLALVLLAIEDPRLYRIFHTAVFALRGRYTAETGALSPTPTEWYRYDVANWQAYIASLQVARIEALIERRRTLYAEYRARLAGRPGFELPPADPERAFACIRFPLRVRGDKYAFYRRAARRGVDFAFSFSSLAPGAAVGEAAKLAASVLDLPFYERLSAEEFDEVVEVMTELGS